MGSQGKSDFANRWDDRLLSITKSWGLREITKTWGGSFANYENMGLRRKQCIAKSWVGRLLSTLPIDGVTDKIIQKVGVTANNILQKLGVKGNHKNGGCITVQILQIVGVRIPYIANS